MSYALLKQHEPEVIVMDQPNMSTKDKILDFLKKDVSLSVNELTE